MSIGRTKGRRKEEGEAVMTTMRTTMGWRPAKHSESLFGAEHSSWARRPKTVTSLPSLETLQEHRQRVGPLAVKTVHTTPVIERKKDIQQAPPPAEPAEQA